ncbi:MAG TPA: carboxypeptidase regulatory-like domain-containing protein [Bryobacteraceae bacterium]|nr:carboxypeptidase regulatory-like domain-containing protein [Bryobacteraceae bacterium]
MSNKFFNFTILVLAALIAWLPLAAQVDVSSATLKGTVLDPTGAAVPGATVTVANPERGLTKIVNTGDDGTYQIPLLQPGMYRVEVEFQGFEKVVANQVELTIGASVIFDIHLKIGSVKDVMEVTEAAPLIEAEKTQQANTLGVTAIDNLPNLTRNFTDSVFTLPGVSNSDAPRLQNPGYTGFLTSGFSVGGSNGRNNLVTFDGGENDYGSGQLRTPNVSVESVQEFQVNRNAFAAEFGFTAGTAVNVVTKSGTNAFHGSAYAFYRNQDTQARNFFDTSANRPFDQNFAPGGTLGGPILKDKLFFFTSYEFRKVDTPRFKSYLNTPDALGINGNPAQLAYVNQLANSGDPALQGIAGLFSQALLPMNNPNVVKLLTANDGVFPDVTRAQDWVTRMDYQPTQNDTLTFRTSFMHWNYTLIGSNNLYASSYAQYIHTQDFGILGSWNHIFGPHVINQLRVQVVPYNNSDSLPMAPGTTELDIGALGTFNRTYQAPYHAQQQRYQFEDYLTWMKGNHTFKFGASYRPVNYTVQNDLWFGGQFTFVDGLSPILILPPAQQAALAGFNLGHGYPADGPANAKMTALESFSLGLPYAYRQGFNNSKWSDWAQYLGAFAQDTWKLTPRFTLSYGARMDFDAEPSPLQHNVYFSPRLGFAWDLMGDQKTVIRAGSGIFVAPVNFQVDYLVNLLNDSGNYINQFATAITSPPAFSSATIWGLGLKEGKLPFGQLSASDLTQLGITVGPGMPGRVIFNTGPNYKNTYSIQNSISIARELNRTLALEVGYQMYKGVHIQLDQETNYYETGVIDPVFGPQYAKINPAITQANSYSSIGNSIYHGLTTSLTKRYSSNFQAQVNYTFSKAIDDATDYNSQFASFFPTRLNLERGISAYNVTHNFVANTVYNTPFKAGSGEPFWSRMFADMTFSPIVHMRSGIPFTVRVPGASNGTVAHNLYARPWYVERNTGIGPDYYDFDARIAKSFYINRDTGFKCEFIAEGTNLLNHTNFSSVNDQFLVTDPLLLTGPFNVHGNKNLGPTSSLGFTSAFPGRQIQFGLRLAF